MCSKEFNVLYVRCIYTDRTQSRVGRRSVRGAFLSSSSRSAPPRDIMLEEPDVMNPGHSHSHVCVTFNRVFVYVITPFGVVLLIYPPATRGRVLSVSGGRNCGTTHWIMVPQSSRE